MVINEGHDGGTDRDAVPLMEEAEEGSMVVVNREAFPVDGEVPADARAACDESGTVISPGAFAKSVNVPGRQVG